MVLFWHLMIPSWHEIILHISWHQIVHNLGTTWYRSDTQRYHLEARWYRHLSTSSVYTDRMVSQIHTDFTESYTGDLTQTSKKLTNKNCRKSGGKHKIAKTLISGYYNSGSGILYFGLFSSENLNFFFLIIRLLAPS